MSAFAWFLPVTFILASLFSFFLSLSSLSTLFHPYFVYSFDPPFLHSSFLNFISFLLFLDLTHSVLPCLSLPPHPLLFPLLPQHLHHLFSLKSSYLFSFFYLPFILFTLIHPQTTIITLHFNTIIYQPFNFYLFIHTPFGFNAFITLFQLSSLGAKRSSFVFLVIVARIV